MTVHAVGAIVQLTSGGPALTVKQGGPLNTTVVWIANDTLKEVTLPNECFVTYVPPV
jgi:uncharacterized protein YodC (DUF2158 family)